MICVGIYAVLVEGISTSGDNISAAIWGCMAIRFCCATPCSRPAALQNPCSAPIKGGRYLRIGLIDVDSHNFPNLCLMKLSEYHTRRGDRVEWWDTAKQL